MKKKKAVKKATEFWVEICEAEGSIVCFPNKEYVLDFVEMNGPVTLGTIEISDKRVIRRILKAFKDGYVATSVPWNKYCEQLGYSKFEKTGERA